MLNKNITLAVLMLSTASAFALDLSEARAKKEVCEGKDGYVHATTQPPTKDVMALIDSVNKQRKTEYQNIADKTSGKIQDAEKAAGEKLQGKGGC